MHTLKQACAAFWRFRGIAGLLGCGTFLAVAFGLRQLSFSSEPIIYSYLQIVGSLLCLTCAAGAVVRFGGTHDPRALILGFGFAVCGAIETVEALNFYDILNHSSAAQMHGSLSWMISRTLFATTLVAALALDRRATNPRSPRLRMAAALLLVALGAYLTGAGYLGSLLDLSMHPRALIARPADLFPALLFAAAAIGFGSRLWRRASATDRIILAAVWLNVACHLAASQSERVLDAPSTLAQVLKVTSYALVLGGALLDNARLFNQIRQLAVTDPLTGLSNYRTLMNALECEMQRSRRTARPFAILLLDLDGLKDVNDNYGHVIGSHALCRLANVLRAHSRRMDTAARYGGDEFALVLPEAGAEAAALVSRRICAKLANDGEFPRVTASVGAAVFPRDGGTAEALFNAADRALYGMKGRSDGIGALARIAACL